MPAAYIHACSINAAQASQAGSGRYRNQLWLQQSPVMKGHEDDGNVL
jgi:hypothetical protein